MSTPLPVLNGLVTILAGGKTYASRVQDVVEQTLALAAPLDGAVEPPELNSALSIVWSGGPRGRYIADARLLSTGRAQEGALPCWTVAIEGAPRIDQRRRFVRFGNGEAMQLLARDRPGDTPISGRVIDISEGGLRSRFSVISLSPGEKVLVTVDLGDDVLATEGRVLHTVENLAWECFEVVVAFDLDQRDSDLVRRYVMRQQMLARRASADAAF